MPRSSLQDVSGLADPLLTYNFDLFFPRIPGFGGNTRPMTIKCQTTALPGMQLEQITTGLHGVEVSHAGRQIWTKTFTATFVETREGGTRQAIRQWIQHARNNATNQGHYKNGGDGYAITGVIHLYDDIPNIIDEIHVYGMFPTQMEDLSLDGAQGAIVSVSVTFSYDYTSESLVG